MFKNLIIFLSFILLAPSICSASALSIETDYRLRGVDYSHTEIFSTTSTLNPLSYYSQRLMLSLKGSFDEGIEIGAKLTSIGTVGSTETVLNLPYAKTDFTPYIENAYIKIKNLGEWPIDISAGKQSICYGDGLIICDNGTGFNSLSVSAHYDLPLPFSKSAVLPLSGEYFTAKISESLVARTDADLYGAVLRFDINKNLWEFGYFEEADFSGTQYIQGSNSYATKAIVKKYLDFRVGRKESISEYQIEIAKQSGYISKPDGTQVNLDGIGYLLSGKLISEKTKVGKVTARGLISVATGDDDPNSFDDDESFSPTYTKRFDGLERGGYGMLFGASSLDSFFRLPDGYSGINTINIGTDISPIYKWTFGMDYFLFSASRAPKAAPEASGFERFYGAEFSLGSELDLSVKFENTKYSGISLAYCSYTPPKASIYWPNSKAVVSYRLEISAKF